ncbi:MAG: hypothetical protein HYY20_00805 [Candidatus Tectomicrobia bacterium]|uniref:Uncharacterized protein n=1 Tax=Tectimicrobiota bacterium TaxID=2528274 RepID=A0A932FUA8_UNCTE|nr:hypothetical protein [Candidatus Tectomicrobia bacterium]
MRPFQSLREYECFVYSLADQFPRMLRSTLVVFQRGRYFAELTGEILFPDGYRLNVYERLSWDTGPLKIEGYSYEVWCGSEELYWYDSQPHPNDPALASADPHHKHIPPDIKHHRVPAPGLSFAEPNLPFLIQEIESMFFRN